ncbi:MAG TPA: hypothetical protein VGM92_04695, partial [Candidatus Kapabacteria bacterium]
MRHSCLKLTISAIAIISVSGCSHTSAPTNLSLQGKVLLEQYPSQPRYDYSGTDVFVENTGFHTTTDASGQFSIPLLPASGNSILISRPDYSWVHIYNWAIPQSGFIGEYILDSLQPQIPAVIDSIILKDTILLHYNRTGVVVGNNNDTLNYGVVNITSSYDTNVFIYGHATSQTAIKAVIFLGN